MQQIFMIRSHVPKCWKHFIWTLVSKWFLSDLWFFTPRCLGKNTMPAELSIVSQHPLAVQNPYRIGATRHQQQISIEICANIVGDCVLEPYVLPPHLTGPNYTAFFERDLPVFLDNFPTDHQRNNVLHPQWRIPHFSLAAHQFFNCASCAC